MKGKNPGLLHGRQSERAVLDRQLAKVRDGHSAVLVLRGEAGIGKSALLEYVAESAEGCTVVRAAGVEAEMELAFGGCTSCARPSWIASGTSPIRSGRPWRPPSGSARALPRTDSS